MKKLSKVLAIVLALSALCIFTACNFALDQVESIKFVKAPQANYAEGAVAPLASEFSVAVKVVGQETEIEFDLSNPALTVIGLDGDKLDMTPGTHTIVVIYLSVRCEFTYTVAGETTLPEWTESVEAIAVTDNVCIITKAEQLAYLAKMAQENKTAWGAGMTIKLDADIDLAGKNWTPIEYYQGSFDGNNKTISNLTIKAAAESQKRTGNNIGFGLFGYTCANVDVEYKNVTLKNFNMELLASEGFMYKNFACLIGSTNSAVTYTITGIIVENCNIKAEARIGAIVGQSHSNAQVNISNCTVSDCDFITYNRVSVATEDGEGDKVGAIGGQIYNVNVNNCTVIDCNIVGTRDVAGLIGFARNIDAQNNTIEDTLISANVPGGMIQGAKGTRNAAGIVGIIELSGANTIVIKNNEIKADVIITVSSQYENSFASQYIGGFRAYKTNRTATIEGITSTDWQVALKEVNDYNSYVDWAINYIFYLNAEIADINGIAII